MILAVDDEPHIRHVLRHVLQRAGHEVILADNGQEALELLEQHPEVQMVVTDIAMPVLDGFELIEKLRTNSQIPILVLTASGEEQFESQAKALGANCFITKPFAREDLLREVERHL